MKKIIFKINPNRINVRHRWLINPVTRVISNKKVYNRKREKIEIRRYLGKCER